MAYTLTQCYIILCDVRLCVCILYSTEECTFMFDYVTDMYEVYIRVLVTVLMYGQLILHVCSVISNIVVGYHPYRAHAVWARYTCCHVWVLQKICWIHISIDK